MLTLHKLLCRSSFFNGGIIRVVLLFSCLCCIVLFCLLVFCFVLFFFGLRLVPSVTLVCMLSISDCQICIINTRAKRCTPNKLMLKYPERPQKKISQTMKGNSFTLPLHIYICKSVHGDRNIYKLTKLTGLVCLIFKNFDL